MDTVWDCAIVGGGIVGLATGLKLLERWPGLALGLLEKESAVGTHQTGRNSGVIHSGLYYKPGSLKAKTCVEGARRMAAFCAEHGVPHRRCGKVVVAVSEAELPALEELRRRGAANGVPGIEELGPERLREIEPHARGVKALWVPGTGIVDYRTVAAKYRALIEQAGGTVRTGCRLRSIRRDGPAETVLETTGGAFRARFLVNCAGLHSDRVARLDGAHPDARIVPFRGEYYQLAPAAERLVRGLIYPVPDPRFPFLGVHFTTMIAGGVEAGPNAVLALQREGYTRTSFNLCDAWSTFAFPGFWRMAARFWKTGLGELYRSFSAAAFTRALQRLVPDLRRADLRPGGAGVRAQALAPDGGLVDDFRMVRGERSIHVLNAPSPAATASLCIGEQLAAMVVETMGR